MSFLKVRMIIMLRMPETNGVVGRGRKRSRQHCQLSLLCCWSPRHMWLSRVGTGYAVASGPVLGRALAQRPGEEQTEGHPSSVCGGNELLGLVGAVTGHCFHSRENSIPVPPVTGPSNFPRLTSLIVYCFWLSGHLCAYNPGYSFCLNSYSHFKTSPDTPRTVQRPPSALARAVSL